MKGVVFSHCLSFSLSQREKENKILSPLEIWECVRMITDAL